MDSVIIDLGCDFNEFDVSLHGILEGFLNKMCDKLKEHLKIRTILPEPQHDPKTMDFVLIVGRGDILSNLC